MFRVNRAHWDIPHHHRTVRSQHCLISYLTNRPPEWPPLQHPNQGTKRGKGDTKRVWDLFCQDLVGSPGSPLTSY